MVYTLPVPAADTDVPVTVRFEPPVHERVKRSAAEDRRSFNSQVNWLLREALEARDACLQQRRRETGEPSG